MPEREDLAAAASVGLLEAAKNWDSSREASFRTFASHRIRGAILDERRRMDTLAREMREQVTAGRRTEPKRVPFDEALMPHSREPGPMIQAIRNEMREVIFRLPPDDALLVGLLIWDGLTQAAAGEKMGLSPHVVARRYARAIEALRWQLRAG